MTERLCYTVKDTLHRCAVVVWRALLFMGVNLKAGEMVGLIFIALATLAAVVAVLLIAHYAGWGIAATVVVASVMAWWLRGRAA